MKAGLIKRGVPASQIAFVHDAKDAEARQALLEKVNDGDIRIIIGSTEMMGAGTNFQEHLVALHHVDCCWKPRDIEQREERILRSGNLNKEVEILAYVVKDSYDGNMWEKVERKKAMIDSVLKGDPLVDEIVESGESMSFGELKAAAMGNPLLKERTELHNNVTRLELLLQAHRKEQAFNEMGRDNLLKDIPTLKQQIENYKADITNRIDVKGDNFRMKIGGQNYSDRTEAEKALKKVMQSFKGESGDKIGEIGGFDLIIRFENTYVEKSGSVQAVHKDIELQLVNNGSYRVKTSTIKEIETVLNNSPEQRLNSATVALANAKNELKNREENLNKPFAQQAELDEARRKFEEIDAKINGKSNEQKNPEETSISTNNETTEENISPDEISTNENIEVETKKTFAELSDFRGLSRKQDKDGKEIYYLGSKRIRSNVATKIFREQFKEKQEVLIEKLKNATGFNISLQKFDERPSLSFGTESIYGDIWYTHLKFDNLKEAVATARHLFINYADFIAESDREDFIAVYDEDGKVFSISKIGKENSYTETESQNEQNSAETEARIILPDNPFKKNNSDETKFAGKGDLEKMFAARKEVSDDKLKSWQKKWVELGEDTGVKVVWIDAHKDLNGAVQDGTIYINRRANENPTKTFHHEVFHLISRLNPELHNDLLKYFTGKNKFDAEQIENYRRENNREDLTDSEVIEEILADNFGQIQKRARLMQEIASDDTSLIKRLIAFIKNLAEKFVSYFHNPEGGMTTAQRDAFITGFNKLAASLKDAQGKELYKTSGGGKILKLSDGKELPKNALIFLGKKNIATDKEYFRAVEKFENAKTDSEKQAAYQTLQNMVQQAADAAGFENAVPEQTVAYKVRTKAAPKKTVKVYKVFTVANDGSPTALFIGGTEKLPQNVWLDAQDAYHIKGPNGKYYVPSTPMALT